MIVRLPLLVRCSVLLGLVAPASAWAGLVDAPHEDIHFIAEHAAEAAQDARYFVLAWPSQVLAPGEWTGGFAVGHGEARADFLDVQGELLSFHAFHAVSARNGLSLQGFYDAFDLGGGPGEQILRAPFAPGVPLDLPERIAVTGVRGKVHHFGVGAAWVHELSPDPRHGWSLSLGALLERLEVSGFEIDYRLLGGRDAGTAGVLDHSGTTEFVTPWVGLLRRVPLGSRYSLSLHFGGGAPLPPGDFEGRITGPGFDRSSQDPGGKPGKIGDGFVELGAGILHRPSGIELHLGTALAYPLFETTTHDGVNRSLLLVVSWTRPRPDSPR